MQGKPDVSQEGHTTQDGCRSVGNALDGMAIGGKKTRGKINVFLVPYKTNLLLSCKGLVQGKRLFPTG